MVLGAVLLMTAGATWAQDPKPAKVKRQTNVITQEEIATIQSEATDAYEVVNRLRPQFLRIRGGGQRVGDAELLEIKVVVDNAPRGNTDVLKQIPVTTLKEIRFLNGTDASIQFGTNYGAGAILVSTR
jgi:hypothetical protein